MVCLYLFRGSWMAALTEQLVLSPPLAWARETQLHQFKGLCYFTNWTERCGFACFDSNAGEYRAVTELGRPQAEHCNSQKNVLQRTRAEVDAVCRHINRTGERFTVQRRAPEPTVTVYPAKTQPLQHHDLLVCSLNVFYPGHIEVRWFQNGHDEEAGVISTGLIQNGDWTFQTMVMLETVFTCRVDHPSQMSLLTVEWKAQSDSAQSRMLSGVGGFALGLLFLVVGLFIHFRNQKGKEPVGS
ncbi:hypothetical protein K5549_015736 [Capra hircus]|nr:hypothetical protein K5549_015736 [Capra hircus]